MSNGASQITCGKVTPDNKTLLSSSNYSSIFQNFSEEARYSFQLSARILNGKAIDGAKNVPAKLWKLLSRLSFIGESNDTVKSSGTCADGTSLNAIYDVS